MRINFSLSFSKGETKLYISSFHIQNFHTGCGFYSTSNIAVLFFAFHYDQMTKGN